MIKRIFPVFAILFCMFLSTEAMSQVPNPEPAPTGPYFGWTVVQLEAELSILQNQLTELQNQKEQVSFTIETIESLIETMMDTYILEYGNISFWPQELQNELQGYQLQLVLYDAQLSVINNAIITTMIEISIIQALLGQFGGAGVGPPLI